jgi:2-amino-4-hydroxy-6-hydroxymethyldihydropteridine diphosphokinase
MTKRAYILLGSNLGDKEKNLEMAVKRLSELDQLQVVNCSGVYQSPAFEMEPGSPDFLNQAVEIITRLKPMMLLEVLETIEREFGRSGKGQNKSRIIDLDILLFGNQVIDTERLTIPYRQLLDRPFAMIPLIEIAPDILHPVLDEQIRDYVEDKDRNTVRLLHEYAAE